MEHKGDTTQKIKQELKKTHYTFKTLNKTFFEQQFLNMQAPTVSSVTRGETWGEGCFLEGGGWSTRSIAH